MKKTIFYLRVMNVDNTQWLYVNKNGNGFTFDYTDAKVFDKIGDAMRFTNEVKNTLPVIPQVFCFNE